ncbi:MAG: hypothetical protein ABI042_12440 [Verrucomicrobiota bacterium]
MQLSKKYEFSLTPWLQPGGRDDGMSLSRFNGFGSGTKPLKRFSLISPMEHRAKATVLMKLF